ncbi:asparaginyl/glutamyl-tRNA amidotransferase subunit C [Candidatus Azambacteria bacterium RIFOXYD1_FULL_42_11]|uniref:Aspartyl/glutamyl-tRNA(Asn/Gln) amidotransferase subunit C n=2 Tax=Candidatus Azamiibacteriota TaxID=1752741 RepID=A0A1F5CGH0_9BACT|nr:MAG: asparaginyl/glutamyl-tRNA amidotransferase subunit C [Candidatus Azambacteria bacterium RIFOXYD1_FULL_42_11]
MSLTKKEVKKISELARLGISEEEKEKFAEDLSSVLGYINKLSEVNVEKVEPMTGGTNLESVVRKDDDSKDISDPKMREEILTAAPNRQDDYFKVPSILK